MLRTSVRPRPILIPGCSKPPGGEHRPERRRSHLFVMSNRSWKDYFLSPALSETELLFSGLFFSGVGEPSFFEVSALPSPEDDELDPLPFEALPFDDFLA